MRKKISILAFILLSACHSGLKAPADTTAAPRPRPNPQFLDAPVPGPAASAGTALDFLKGMTLVCWYSGCYQTSTVNSELNFLQSVGVTALAIVPTWYQSTLFASDIAADPDRSPSDEDIRSIIRLARQRGMKILLKPHVDILSGGWRGNIDPMVLGSWHANYQNFILHYARLAEELGVDIFSVGTELKRLSPELSFWRGLIGAVKTVYHGPLTYSANWDEFASVTFWNLLDFIGIDFYFPIASSANATQGEMEDNLERIGEDIRNFSLTHQRPILFTEIGYRSTDGTALRPYDFEREGEIDLQEQAMAYSAVLTAYANADWLKGIFWWREDPQVSGGPADGDYMIYGKPAADVLERFWRP